VSVSGGYLLDYFQIGGDSERSASLNQTIDYISDTYCKSYTTETNDSFPPGDMIKVPTPDGAIRPHGMNNSSSNTEFRDTYLLSSSMWQDLKLY
ncbi:hypothetical protein WHL20_14505, partial [Staphylococcus aureus]|uniref:hypothetical protein n=1 Tax=Staphylococcus aureus TaxID=1280 RepID=UPI0039BDF08C